jgi:hypothetical protein
VAKSVVQEAIYGKGFVKVRHGSEELLFTTSEVLRAKKRVKNATNLTTTVVGKRLYQKEYMKKKRKGKK